MRTQLIQQKVLLGSQVTFTLKTGENVSGLLAEIGIDYITLNGVNGREILDVDGIKAIHLANPVEASGPSSSTLAPTEVNPQIAYNQTLSTSSDAPVPLEEPEPSDTTSVPTEASEPSDAAPVPVKEPEPSDTDPDQIDSVAFEEQASEKLAEIVNRFSTEIQAAKLELEPPDLTFSEIAKDLKNWQNTDVYSKWGQIRNKYEYALKVGELSAEFGRIRPIVAELKSLVIRFPESTTLKRVLTYFYSISSNWEEALQNYHEAAVQSEEAACWFDVAVCALKLNKEELACYSLENFFYGVSILDKPKVWYAYVNLLEKFNNLPAFRELCKTDKYDVEDEEIEVLLETAIYLLQKIGDETLAAEIMPRWLTGESIKSLLGEACQKLDGKPAESYRQFLTAFMNAGIASEKKVVRIIPERVEHIRTVKQPIHRPKPQKQVTPRGDNLYREAKQADSIEKNLEKAERLYQDCIKQNIRRDSAIKDLAMVLVRLERPEEAVELLEDNRSKVKDKQSLDNTLITVYPAAAQYEKAIPLLNDSLSRAQKDEKRAQIRSQIASAYIKLGDYASAGNQFHQVLKLRPDNITVHLNQIQDASPNDFIQLWNELRSKQFDKARTISNDLGFLNNFELTTAWLEDNISLAEDVRSNLLFELDQQRVGELQRILETALELCRQVTFEERERLCSQLDTSCQTLRREIEESPTKLSVEDVYPITEVIQGKVNAYLKELHETSKPQMTIRLPVESYVPNPDRKIDVQIVVQNEKGRSPAESLELVIEGDKAFFTVTELDIKRDESLRGGEQSILKVPLRVTDEALDSQTFSLPIYARYRTRAGEQEETPFENLSVRLYSEDEFDTIENPYAAYAEGGIVGDPTMFFGRDELIQNIAQAIQESRLQSKCVLVFGQKRSGKSSVLYHLKKALETDRKLLVLDLGNIGLLSDRDAKKPLLYQFLNRILTTLARAIRRKQRDGFIPLELSIPPSKEFYEHPAPLQCFEETFEELKDLVSHQEDWRDVQVVLLMDEFQYIYARIVADEIPESFMQNWKALLQANYFSAVLVGQDVMPKFKAQFPNEFGTTQDERVTYLRPDDARNLIDEPIRIDGRQGDSRYREQAIERILDLTAGSPFYIQMLCNRLVEYMNAKHAGLVTEADVEQVKNGLISGVNALDLDKFDNLINSGDTSANAILDEDALKVLKVIADNSRTGHCRRDRIDCDTSLPVDTILADLEKRDVVECREQSYRIRVGLFKEWLIANG